MAFTAPTVDIVEEGDDLSSFVANEEVIRGQVVKLAGEDLGVQPSDTDGENVVGVAVQTKSSGEQVAVAMPGTEVRFTAGESISRGDLLSSHGATGEEGQVATEATGDKVVGVAYEQASSQGDLVHGRVEYAGQVN